MHMEIVLYFSWLFSHFMEVQETKHHLSVFFRSGVEGIGFNNLWSPMALVSSSRFTPASYYSCFTLLWQQLCYSNCSESHFHERTKHIEIGSHLIRDKVQDGTIHLLPIPSTAQIADVHTKALHPSSFSSLVSKLNMIIWHPCFSSWQGVRWSRN